MKTDRFTKILLTIIALNLTYLTVSQMDIFPKAYAVEPATKALTTPGNYALVPVNEDGSINVRLSAMDELDVNITGVSTFDELDVNLVGVDTWDELSVNLDEIGGSSVSSGGPIRVEVEN
ncbi:MAG TPA: hypothetical protein DCE41_06065 [Cytophagales bacterium]|nr:hypothetical protein [Cytophagales bacterium]HAA20669.1 hypothetical protein [Cytophagales bacterium]HAP64505.1 hypothetical protein [Cytophagales bacterium]